MPQTQPSQSSPSRSSDGERAIISSLFLVAVYNGSSFAVPRNPDYEATIASIRKAFPILDNIVSCGTSRIQLSASLNGLNEEPIGINDELWTDISPSLSTVHISVVRGQLTKSGEWNQLHQVIVCVKDTDSNVQELQLPLFPNSTIRQLRNLVLQHDHRLPPHLGISLDGMPNLDDNTQIHECGNSSQHVFYMSTELAVYLVGPTLSKRSINIPIFATVHTLKLLSIAQEDSNRDIASIRPSERALTCAGELLDDKRILWSYPQIVAECEVYANKAHTVRRSNPNPEAIILRVFEAASLYEEADGESFNCLVFPESSILDLKALISYKISESFARLTLSDWSHKPLEDDYTIGDRFNSGDSVWLSINEDD